MNVKKCWQSPEGRKREEKIFFSAFRASVGLLTPWFWTCSSHTCERIKSKPPHLCYFVTESPGNACTELNPYRIFLCVRDYGEDSGLSFTVSNVTHLENGEGGWSLGLNTWRKSFSSIPEVSLKILEDPTEFLFMCITYIIIYWIRNFLNL